MTSGQRGPVARLSARPKADLGGIGVGDAATGGEDVPWLASNAASSGVPSRPDRLGEGADVPAGVDQRRRSGGCRHARGR